MTSIRFKIIIRMVLVLVLLMSGFYLTFYNASGKFFGTMDKNLSQRAANRFKNAIQNDVTMLEVSMEVLNFNPALAQAFVRRDRQSLLELAEPIYRNFHKRHRISHFYFTDLRRQVFLRVYEPQKYGDTVNRYTMLEAEKTGKPAYGLEIGPYGTLTLRYVEPYFFNGQHIGYIELALEIEHALQNMASGMGVELSAALYKRFLDRTVYQQGMQALGKSDYWHSFPDLAIIYGQHSEAAHQAWERFIASGFKLTDKIQVESQGQQFKVVDLALRTADGEAVGALLVLANVSGLVSALDHQLLVLILGGVLISAIAVWVLYRYLGVLEGDIEHQFNEVLERDKQLEEAIQKQLKISLDLKNARDQAETANRMKAAFLANTSHEIRTPMNAIKGFTELALEDSSVKLKTREYLRTISKSAAGLMVVINDILDISKLESGHFELEHVCFNWPQMVKDALDTVRELARQKGLQLHFQFAAGLPEQVMGDPMRLRQVLLNLVGNAIKFTESGSVSIKVKRETAPEMLYFEVIDTGIGIPQASQEHIFEAFTQADESMTRRFGGTGLGIKISRQLVELMGGELGLSSVEGVGSTFYFRVPLEAAVAGQNCLFSQFESSSEMYRSPRLFKVLLAEDLEVNATLVRLRLEEVGHQVHWAKNGYEVIQAYQKEPCDLILMDIQMPEMDGLEATRRIRAQESGSGKHLPMLALTASVMPQDRAMCTEAGLDEVVAKPIDFDELFRAMEAVVPEGIGEFALQPPAAAHEPGLSINFEVLEGLVDYQAAMRSWHDLGAYIKALKSFARERSQVGQELQAMLEQQPEAVQEVAHALKGLAGNLGIESVARISTALDTAVKTRQWQHARNCIDELDPEIERVVAAIKCLAIEPLQAPGEAKSFDPQQFAELLHSALASLEQYNPDAVWPTLAPLAQYLSPAEHDDIRRAVESFEFDQARVLLEALKSRYLEDIAER